MSAQITAPGVHLIADGVVLLVVNDPTLLPHIGTALISHVNEYLTQFPGDAGVQDRAHELAHLAAAFMAASNLWHGQRGYEPVPTSCSMPGCTRGVELTDHTT
jgi:hypothetical protein